MYELLVQQGSGPISPNGVKREQAGMRRGAGFIADWRQQLISEGKGFVINVGAFSTPITGGGNGTIIDIDQPELVVGVPDGKTLYIVRCDVDCQVPLLANDSDEAEILLAADVSVIAASDGTATGTITPQNMKTNSAETSGLSPVAYSYSVDMTDPTLGLEIAREVITGDVQGTPATALWTQLKMRYEPRTMMELVGPCGVFLYWGGTVAVTGFAKLEVIVVNTIDN